MVKILVCSALWLGVMGVWAGAIKASASDIEQHWAKETITSLIEQGIINGYADGTFRPDHNINRDEYIKLVVVALGHPLENGSPYWAQPYLDKAQELGIVNEGEFMEYNVPANREEMASIITRAAALSETAPEYEYDYTIPEHISDYEQISPKYQGIVVNSYRYGLITGKQVGVFAPTDNSTRAEAATVIARLLDPEKRNTYQSYVENHPAMQSGYIYEIKSQAITPVFFEKYKDRKDISAYGSADVLAERVRKARELVSQIKVTIDEENEQYTIAVPEHSDDLGFILTTLTMQTYDSDTYVVKFSEASKKNGFIYELTIYDRGDYKGSWTLYSEYGYISEGKYLRSEAPIAKPILYGRAE